MSTDLIRVLRIFVELIRKARQRPEQVADDGRQRGFVIRSIDGTGIHEAVRGEHFVEARVERE